MEIKHTVKTTCRFCRREFASFALKKVCNECEARMDDNFTSIRNYIDENPGATVGEICTALDMPTALIKFYLKEERLSIRETNRNLFLRCEGCHKPISTGRFCKECEIKEVRNSMSVKMNENNEIEIMDRAIASFYMRSSHSSFSRKADELGRNKKK